MYQLELELSTGHQFQLPSENTAAAMQVEGIQSLLERKDQMKSNISTTQSYLGQTDSTLTSVSNLLTSIQSTALARRHDREPRPAASRHRANPAGGPVAGLAGQ